MFSILCNAFTSAMLCTGIRFQALQKFIQLPGPRSEFGSYFDPWAKKITNVRNSWYESDEFSK